MSTIGRVRMKILIIEDEVRIATYLKKGLEQQKYLVDVEHDGLNGYEQAASLKYDVLIIDRMLPGISGIDICQKLRQEKNETPILLLTAKTAVSERVEGLNSGADDYLGKPFAFAELVARVKALHRRKSDVSDGKLSADTLKVNTTTFEVTRSQQPISLTKKEFALLEFLMRNANMVWTKEQLAEQVWSYDSDILSNTVQVFIGYLRSKIDKAFPNEKPLIHTVHGFGYRFGSGT